MKQLCLSGFLASLFRDDSDTPLGNLTFDEASFYFTAFCELMGQDLGFWKKESRLPTSFDRMKEALMVECLNWCNHGEDFDDSCNFMWAGCVHLANFVPDELAEKTSLEAAKEFLRILDMESLKANTEARTAAVELRERRMNALNVEWAEFVKTHQGKYVSGR
jgi:hypothetical protein